MYFCRGQRPSFEVVLKIHLELCVESKIFSHEFEMGILLELNVTHYACSRIKLKILSPVNKLSDRSR